MTCKVYIASPLAQAYRAREYAERLRISEEFAPCSQWHDLVTELVDPTDESTRRSVLIENLSDLNRADCVLALMSWGVPRGAHAEIGYALALGKRVVWLAGSGGEGMSIFTAHSLVTLVTEHREVLPALYAIKHELAESPSATRMRLPSSPPSDASGAFRAATEMLPKKAGAR